MSGAKVKMREKKLRNQPSSVQYSSVQGVGRSCGPEPHDGPSDSSSYKSKKAPHQGGWVRGHHQDDGSYAEEMPKFITAGNFARARAAEVSAMLKAVTKTTGSSHVFGALPKHMRRRAMSHNIKRLPRRLRDVANRMREKSCQAAPKKKEQAKSKSRKARRRHGNLLLEFNRRQQKTIWLETHIWHAKRFHMVKKWGYCLGDRPTYKCYRSCYRAMSSHSLLQDLSYYCCIELQGEEDKLLTALSQLTNKVGPTFASAVFLSGCRQGCIFLYRAEQYPSQPLGLVTFLWRPKIEGSALRQLWIWAHPALKQDLLPELQNVCLCNEAVALVTPVEAHSTTESEAEPKRSPETKLAAGAKRKMNRKDISEPSVKKILGDGTRSTTTPVSWKSSITGIIINDLTMEILRFRLIGPQSHSVLTDTLEAATLCDKQHLTQTSSLWWPELCKDESRLKLHHQQAEIFLLLKGIFSCSELPAGTVLGLTVDDPRVSLPTKKVKAAPSVKQAEEVCEEKRRELTLRGVPEHCCQSYLWDQSVRQNVTENKIPEQTLNHMKSEVLVPGSRLNPTAIQGRIPILLVHQPGKQLGNERSCWGAGWDVLLPKGWGMAFWVSLIYRGVRVGGLNLSLKHDQNKAIPHFPNDYPDCPAGVRFQEEQEAELIAKLKRHPPTKRANYIKHGCLAPFRCPWQQLAEEWKLLSKDVGEQMKRDCPVTEEQVLPLGCLTVKPQHFTVLRSRRSLRLLSCWCRPKGQRLHGVGEPSPLSQSAASTFVEAHGMSLVWVRLSLLAKGKPELHAMLCVPTAEDLRLLGAEQKGSGPQEPPHKDYFKNQIKQLKKNPKMVSLDNNTSQSESSDLVLGLWPDPLPSIISHCSRVLLGWVTQGDFSLSAGCGEALGFVSVSGLIHTIISQPAEHRGTLLLRNPTSLHYRFVKVKIDI